MSTTRKRSWALGALALLAVWPAIHFGLYRSYGIEAWKLCGWAMYARPRGTQQIALMELNDGRPGRIQEISERATEELVRLSGRRSALGALQPMDALGEVLLEDHPDADGIRIVVRRVGFSCDSGRIDAVTDATYDYRR